MLVDQYGDVIVTNDGVTILENMEVNHPAAKMVVNLARSQKDEVGDGTTTATILAGALVAEGASRIMRGVPASRVIEGIRDGVREASMALESMTKPVEGFDDPALYRIAFIAGRENGDIAALAVDAARLAGEEKLLEDGFKLSDSVIALEGAANEVFNGVIVDKEPVNDEMPRMLADVRILVMDDALEPESLDDDVLGTEGGFSKLMELRSEYEKGVQNIVDAGVRLVLADRGITDYAEQLLTDAGVTVCQRVSSRELRRTAEHVGARMLKRTGLKRLLQIADDYLGYAATVRVDERLSHLRIEGGEGKPYATILVGASTAAVVGERERMARDSASSVQAAFRKGYLPGGGASELAAARRVSRAGSVVRGMASYGWDCVTEALKHPLGQMVRNAGYNPLEKIEDATAAQEAQHMDSLSVDCDSGEIIDMTQAGVYDPLAVKLHALEAAGEVAIAILRINTIVRKRGEYSDKDQASLPESYK